MEKPSYGGKGNLVDLYQRLVKVSEESEQVRQELVILEQSPGDQDQSARKGGHG